ncbi:MBL fold metallo-hydrolase [Patescibacteria group bacterium]|nr:MBL fold metallo-hydrolase [Patescibacteria group bacterium]
MKKEQLNIGIYIIGGLLLINLVFLGYSIVFLKGNIPEENLRVIFLDIGQGDAVLIQTSEQQNILVDGGPDKSIIYKLDKYMPINNRQIDLMILSHSGLDHLAGLVEVLRRYQVNSVIGNGLEDFSPAYLEWISLIQEKDIPRLIINQGEIISLSDQVSIHFFWPDQELIKGLTGSDNFASLVFKLIHHNNSFLFTGDATKETEEELIKAGYDLRTDVLKVGHHGSKYSSTLEFLQKVQPEYGVISVGVDNNFGHPSLRALKNLEKVKAEVLRTDQLGDIVFLSDGRELELTFEK